MCGIATWGTSGAHVACRPSPASGIALACCEQQLTAIGRRDANIFKRLLHPPPSVLLAYFLLLLKLHMIPKVTPLFTSSMNRWCVRYRARGAVRVAHREEGCGPAFLGRERDLGPAPRHGASHTTPRLALRIDAATARCSLIENNCAGQCSLCGIVPLARGRLGASHCAFA